MGDLTLRNARGLSLTESVLSSCQRVEDLLTSKTPIVLNGSALDVGAVVVVAQYVFFPRTPVHPLTSPSGL